MAYAGSRKVGLSVGGVEGFIRGAVLVHLNGKAEPGFGIRVRRSPIGHSCKGHRDLTVEALAEFGRGFGVEGHEVFSELLFEIDPVNEAEVSRLRFMFKFTVRPAACTSGFHVGHCPDDLCETVLEGFRAEADVGSAGRQECLARRSVAIKLGGSGRLKKVLSPPRGGSGYRGGLGAAAGRGWIGSGTFQACAGPSLSRTSCRSLWVASF